MKFKNIIKLKNQKKKKSFKCYNSNVALNGPRINVERILKTDLSSINGLPNLIYFIVRVACQQLESKPNTQWFWHPQFGVFLGDKNPEFVWLCTN